MADDILKNIPLPADLPENWTSQQTVAPTGAEVGLDEPHGYNYLMKQVNNAQKALKVLAAQREEDLARIKFWVSTDPTSPAELFGGTWERIEGSFIMGASDTYPAGSTGGNVTHSHNYGVQAPYYYGAIVGEDGEAIKIADYSSDGSVSMTPGYSSGTDTVKANAQLIASYVDRTCTLLKATAKVSYESSLPPYYSMYIWRRVA